MVRTTAGMTESFARDLRLTDTERPVCDCPEPCGCYAAGKDKAYFEIEMALKDDTHAGGCGCRPCRIKRAVLEMALLTSIPPLLEGHDHRN